MSRTEREREGGGEREGEGTRKEVRLYRRILADADAFSDPSL
jgi:hypothetical protein